MDRAAVRTGSDGGWQVLMVPAADAPVRRVRLSARELAAWKALAAAAIALAIGLVVVLAFAWPRSRAYGELVDENLELKGRLDAIDHKMGEVDRILLRLKVYDAQLQSVAPPGAPSADPEERPPDAFPPDAALPDPSLPAQGPAEELPDLPDPAPGDGGRLGDGDRGAEAWAAEVDARLDAFLVGIREVEPDLARILTDLESVSALQKALPTFWPAEGLVTSAYGWRKNPFGGRRWRHHAGLDIGGQRGFPIYAAADGKVVLADWDGGFGKAVHLDHGYGLVTLYGHLSRVLVKAGTRVRAGDRIGLMGSTGHSTGPHLHFEVHVDGHPVDPLDYLRIPPSALQEGVSPPALMRRR